MLDIANTPHAAPPIPHAVPPHPLPLLPTLHAAPPTHAG